MNYLVYLGSRRHGLEGACRGLPGLIALTEAGFMDRRPA